jgi:DNA-binding HxlR family transcriptional regulator
MNGLVSRTVCDTKPITVQYELTEYSHSLNDVLVAMEKWGYQHRNKIVQGIK